MARKSTPGTKSSTATTATASTVPAARSGADVLAALDRYAGSVGKKELNKRRFRALLAMRKCLAVPSWEPISLAPFGKQSKPPTDETGEADGT